jgi:ferredoxin
MRVTVDAERCEGHARCRAICPEVFSMDEDSHAFVSAPDVPAALEQKVREAVANCPDRAISVS